jgi:hypothetical protein
MVDRCTEILCLKENIWEEIVQKNQKIKLFQSKDRYLAILYDMFYITEFKNVINSLEKKNKILSIYAFSHYKIDDSDFSDLNITYEIQEIPDPILEVYESIF